MKHKNERYHSIPYERNLLFVGRELILAELDKGFTTVGPELKIVELVGMPGVGKTEIALEYAYQSLNVYQTIIWLPAPSYHQFAENISLLLRTFGMQLAWRTDEERATIFETFRRWLRPYQSSLLLILDDCDNYNLVNAVLDEDAIGHILLTNDALDTTNADELKTVVVTSFDDEEGPLFLLHRAGLLANDQPLRSASRALRQAALAIHHEFGGHPLALDQAGAYVSETGGRLADYLPLYRQNRRAFLNRRGTASVSHPLPAYQVIAAMRRRGAYNTKKLLMLYIRKELDCSNPYPRLPAALLRDLDLDQADLLGMRHTLIRYFLLLPLRRTYDIHPLVQVVMLEVLAYEEAEKQRGHENDAVYEPLNENDIVQLLSDVQEMKKRSATLKQDDPEAFELSRRIVTTVNRLRRAVLPGDSEQREVQKSKIERYYAGLLVEDDAHLSVASQQDMRRYAHELLAFIEYRQ